MEFTGKVCVAIPSGDMMHARFVASTLDLLGFHALRGWKVGENLYFQMEISSRLAQNRNALVKKAREEGASHILFVDSDMTFPLYGLHELLLHDKDIVGATACKRTDADRRPIGIPADQQDAVVQGKRLVEMSLLGLPFTLIKTSVFDKLEEPYFAEPFVNGALMGEDVYFCKIAREAGFKVWCDLGLSLEIGHLGVKEFKIDKELS